MFSSSKPTEAGPNMTQEAGITSVIIPMPLAPAPAPAVTPASSQHQGQDSPNDAAFPITPPFEFDRPWPIPQELGWIEMPKDDKTWAKDAAFPPPHFQPLLPPIHALRDGYAPAHYDMRNHYHPSAEIAYPAYPTPAQFYVSPSTIQPSQMAAWQGDKARNRPLGGLLEGERRDSMGSSGVGVDLREQYGSTPGSPASELLEREEVPPDMTQVVYTDDAEVKLSEEIKRKCHNCASTSPPSWRKSLIAPGKILCNKCGIYERTHHRARPPQNDEQKLRRLPMDLHKRPPLAVHTQIPYSSSPLSSPYGMPTQGQEAYAYAYASPMPSAGPSSRRSNHPGAYWHGHIAPGAGDHRSRSSPYHHSYANRRAVPYPGSAHTSVQDEASRPSTPRSALEQPAIPELVRRHSRDSSQSNQV